MLFVILLIIGFVFLALGVHLVDSSVRSLMYVGLLDLIFGGILLCICLYNIKPIETNTEVGAVCVVYNNGATAGVIDDIIPDLESDGCTFVETGIISVDEYADEYDEYYVQDDIDLLARLITAEMGYGASEDAYYYTASVVWNRMRSDKFPDELKDVIYQPGQYQCVDNGHIERDYDDVAWEVAEAVIEYGTWIPENVVYQAEFVQGSGIWKQVGRTYFCYE